VTSTRPVGRDLFLAVVGGLVGAAAAVWWVGRAYAAAGGDRFVATGVGWLPVVLCAVAVWRRRPRVGTPADAVTLGRAVLACGCAALASLAVLAGVSARTWVIVALAVPMLSLDAVDGWVARRTNSATAAGARLDMELDAGVVLILSVAVATVLGWWVVVIGGLRYGYGAAAAVWPALGRPLPRSRFRKVVAGLQGGALTIALAPIVPLWLGGALVAGALALLVASFASQAVLSSRAQLE
jgi:phosphatidylglycerophosphate synthase